jgi:NodT family efflux transporter outer membrane factor (OMF) lipoprotein
MRANYIPGLVAILAATALSGCKVGPNYKTPAMPAPPAYSNDGHYGDWASAKPADAADRGAWWVIYQDPELNDLEQRCAAANQSIAAALHAYEQAHDVVRENHAALYPTVSIGAGASRNRISANKPLRPPNQANNYWDFLIPLSISWEPDLWGGIRRQIESSSANAQASAAELANTRLSLQGMLAVTFFQLRGLDLQAQLLRSTIDTYTQTLQLTQVLLKGGLTTEIDVEEAQAQLEQARAQLIDLGEQRAQFEHAIAVLVGEPATGFTIPERPLTGNPPVVPTGVPSELLQRRPDIAAAERQVAASNALIGVAKAAYYPNITLGAGSGIESSAISSLFNSSSAEWNAGPSASELLYDAGRRKAQVDFAVAQREQATALYRGQVLSAFRDVEDQLSSLRVLEEEAAVEQRAVDAATRSTDLSLLRYKRGIAAYLEVLTNQSIQLADERTAAALVARRIVASAQLQMALGGGWSAAQLPNN